MISGENLFSNLLTVCILLGLGLIVYCKMTGKTLVDVVKDMREAFGDGVDETYQVMPDAFSNIR